MTCSDAALERLARSAEFERLAAALDEGRYLIADGQIDLAYEYFTDVIEEFPADSIFMDWFSGEVLMIMREEENAVLAD